MLYVVSFDDSPVLTYLPPAPNNASALCPAFANAQQVMLKSCTLLLPIRSY